MHIKSRFRLVGPVLMFLLAAGIVAPAQALGAKDKKEAVQAIALAYETGYVYPAVGKKMADLLRRKAAAGKYDALAGGRELAREITADLFSVCADRHAVVAFMPERIQKRKNSDPQRLAAEELQEARRANFGLQEARIMAGNVGNLKLTSFAGSTEALAAAAAAMQFLGRCEALVIDVRFNPGGDAAMAQFLASYFFEGEPVLLDEFHYRRDGRIDQLWSLPYVPGKKLTGTDLYILIDAYTFSAAEGLAYDLQALKRAVIVGVPSVGGAHVTETQTVLDSYLLFMPVAYSKNPVTGTNFQGKGVQPDLQFNGETALLSTHIHALEQLLKKSHDPSRKAELEAVLKKVKEKMEKANSEAEASDFVPSEKRMTYSSERGSK